MYKERGLEDFNLRNAEDLLVIHGVNLRQIEGFSKLEERYKCVFINSVINYLNYSDFGSRAITPLRVYVAMEKRYVSEDGKEVKAEVFRVGSNEVRSTWEDEGFKGRNMRIDSVMRYVRFEFIEEGNECWMQIR